ncbi:conserved membrane hypothetical protein [Pseudomonas sp. 8BK]|nr:conserved membrane hypothetical protein [Pseudomonas sp. 8BK]
MSSPQSCINFKRWYHGVEPLSPSKDVALKYLFDLFKAHAATVLQITICVGVFVVFAYWAFIINFFPAGITLSESLLFVFAALMFGLFYSLWYLMAVAAVHGLFHWRASQTKFDGGLFIIGIATAGMLGAAAWSSQNVMVLVAPLLGALILLMIPWYWRPLPRGTPSGQVRRRERDKALITLTAIILPLIFVPEITSKLISNSMQRLGFRQMDVSVSLDAANQKIIKGVVDEFDIKLHSCGSNKNPEQIVHHVNVLWHGLGERTLIEMPFHADASGSPYQVELNRSGVNIVRRPGSQASIPLCFSLGNDLLFDTYASTLTLEGITALTTLLENVKVYEKHSERLITAVSVTGHSDRVPVSSANDSNQKLSRRRAESVAEHLKALRPDLHLSVKAAGSQTPVSSCSNSLSKGELNECLAIDRRVEIVIQTKAK